MSSHPGFGAAASSLPTWNLLFAREPEPDLDFDDGPEAPDRGEGTDPDEPDEPSGGKKWITILVVLVIAGGLYYAWDSGMLSGLLGSTDNAPVASSPSGQSDDAPPPSPGHPPQATGEMPNAPPPQMPPQASPPPSMPPPRSGSPIAAVQPPAFGEGQQVSVVPDPTLPAAAVSLNSDAAETKPGPIVSPTTVLIVVDGEFRNSGWVYTVRTPDGTTGWVSERRLRTVRP